MSITITPSATVSIKDSSISPNPNPIPFGGVAIKCTVGQSAQEMILPANTVDAEIPFPIGVSTSVVIAIWAQDIDDLIVTAHGQAFNVPLQQPFFLYGIAADEILISSAAGGKIVYVVGS